MAAPLLPHHASCRFSSHLFLEEAPMMKRALVGLMMTSLIACAAPAEEAEAPRQKRAEAEASTSSGGAGEVQPWVQIMEPGQSEEDEANDGDGWCASSEGVIPCDDGAEPGSGGEPPPGYTSSTSSNSGGAGA